MSAPRLALAFSFLLALSALPLSVPAAEPKLLPTHLVWDAPAGLAVVDDYGAFATARLAPGEAAALAADGARVEALDLAVLRGAHAIRGSDAAVPAQERAGPGEPFFVVQFRGPVKAAWREALQASAVRVYDPLPHFAYVAKLAPGAEGKLAAMPEVAFVGPYHPAYKLSPELPAEGTADVAVLTFPGEALDGVVQRVALAGGSVRSVTTSFPLDGIVKASLPAARVLDVARDPAVSWIEPAYDGITLDNSQASAISQTGQLGNYRVHDMGVDGSSQVVSVCDTGVRTTVPGPVTKMTHEMYDDSAFPVVVAQVDLPPEVPLHRKIHKYYVPIVPDFSPTPVVHGDWTDSDGHGTHTAGTLAGDAPPYGQRNGQDGVAFAARLVVCDITLGPQFYVANDYAAAYWQAAYDAGARVNSNSWGSPHTTAYSDKARQHDAYVADHRDFVIARSMGNTGGNTIRPEAVAKNALGVGGVVNGASMENLYTSSSRGPTQDGRIKPNVIAPAQGVSSAGTGANNYVSLSGTSMSTPNVAGTAALVQDYFAKGFYPSGTAMASDAFQPSAALVRAMLEVSGKRITGSSAGAGFPNANMGWGRVLLDDAMHFAGDARKLVALDEGAGAGLMTGDSRAVTLQVAAGQPLRVLVAWTDEPAAAGANPALVNDLDVEVTGPGGATYLGNAFVNGEVLPGQGSADRRNVEEAVYVDAPAAGTYTVTVRGANVPSGPQTFALVATHG